MIDRSGNRPCFVQQMRAQLLNYEIDKITRRERELQANGELFRRQRQAKDALIDLDNEETSMLTDEDYYIGRWSHYRVPEKIEERLSLNRRSGKAVEDGVRPFRILDRERMALGHNCQSERTIPKLKVMLHQLQQPLELPPSSAKKIAELGKKMKNHIGRQALVISNKQQIRSHAQSQRKMSATIQTVRGSQNKRPQSKHDSIKGQTCTNNTYQKIKRPFGFHNQHEKDLVYQREILSQLMKGKTAKPSTDPSPLANMVEYFTMSQKRKKPSKIGLDKLLS